MIKFARKNCYGMAGETKKAHRPRANLGDELFIFDGVLVMSPRQ